MFTNIQNQLEIIKRNHPTLNIPHTVDLFGGGQVKMMQHLGNIYKFVFFWYWLMNALPHKKKPQTNFFIFKF